MTPKMSLLAATALVVAACGGAVDGGAVDGGAEGGGSTPSTSAPDATPAPPSTTETGEVVVPDHLSTMAAAWNTDFSNTTINLNELLVGIPAADPRDLIRPIDDPQFENVAESTWVEDREPGVLLDIDGDVRFYPLSVLTRHEIVNDVVGDVPVAVTYCPLCNTALAFDRRFEGDVLRLGVSGLLRNSDLVMWDDLTHSLWQQITGEAIVGEHAGKSLTPIASAIVRWADFKATHPNGQTLGPDQGFGRGYGINPYVSYSSGTRPYGFFTGEIDERFPALERVVGVTVNDTGAAYPFSLISEVGVVNDTIDGVPVVIFWGAGDTADALDSSSIADSRGIGTGVAYSPVVNGQTLTFESLSDTEFADIETGTTWSILGKAISGELAGEELELMTHRNEFWFAWQAFFPDAAVWEG